MRVRTTLSSTTGHTTLTTHPTLTRHPAVTTHRAATTHPAASTHPAAVMTILRGLPLVLLTAAVLLVSGCGGSSSGSSASPSPAPSSSAASSSAPATASAPAGAVKTVTATEKEFSITLSRSTFAPGSYTFNVVNKGTFPHNLNIAGPGVTGAASPTLPAGQSGTVTVTLKAGSYELWCSVDSHKDRGMDIKITVA